MEKKWCVLEERGIDGWLEKFESKEEAIEYAKNPLKCERSSGKKVTVGLFELDDDGEWTGDIWEIWREENVEE